MAKKKSKKKVSSSKKKARRSPPPMQEQVDPNQGPPMVPMDQSGPNTRHPPSRRPPPNHYPDLDTGGQRLPFDLHHYLPDPPYPWKPWRRYPRPPRGITPTPTLRPVGPNRWNTGPNRRPRLPGWEVHDIPPGDWDVKPFEEQPPPTPGVGGSIPWFDPDIMSQTTPAKPKPKPKAKKKVTKKVTKKSKKSVSRGRSGGGRGRRRGGK